MESLSVYKSQCKPRHTLSARSPEENDNHDDHCDYYDDDDDDDDDCACDDHEDNDKANANLSFPWIVITNTWQHNGKVEFH